MSQTLDSEECDVIIQVLVNDIRLRVKEQQRLHKQEQEFREQEQVLNHLQRNKFGSGFCIFCCRRFWPFLNPRCVCYICHRQSCYKCGHIVQPCRIYLCRQCRQERELLAMSCPWFYLNVGRKFRKSSTSATAEELMQNVSMSYSSQYSVLKSIQENNIQLEKVVQQVYEQQKRELRMNIQEICERFLLKLQDLCDKMPRETALEVAQTDDVTKAHEDEIAEVLRGFVQVNYFSQETKRQASLTPCVFSHNLKDEVFTELINEVEGIIGHTVEITPLITLSQVQLQIQSSPFVDISFLALEETLAKELLRKVTADFFNTVQDEETDECAEPVVNEVDRLVCKGSSSSFSQANNCSEIFNEINGRGNESNKEDHHLDENQRDVFINNPDIDSSSDHSRETSSPESFFDPLGEETICFATQSDDESPLSDENRKFTISKQHKNTCDCELPQFTVEPLESYSLMAGEKLLVNVFIKGKNPIDVRWINPSGKYVTTKDLRVVLEKRFQYVEGEKVKQLHASLTLWNVKLEDSGKYCFGALTPHHKLESSFSLIVNKNTKTFSPPSFSMPLTVMKGDQGGPVELHCKVSGYPEPRVSFFQNDAALQETVHRNEIFQTEDGTYVIIVKGVSDVPGIERYLLCYASNVAGFRTSTADISSYFTEPFLPRDCEDSKTAKSDTHSCSSSSTSRSSSDSYSCSSIIAKTEPSIHSFDKDGHITTEDETKEKILEAAACSSELQSHVDQLIETLETSEKAASSMNWLAQIEDELETLIKSIDKNDGSIKTIENVNSAFVKGLENYSKDQSSQPTFRDIRDAFDNVPTSAGDNRSAKSHTGTLSAVRHNQPKRISASVTASPNKSWL